MEKLKTCFYHRFIAVQQSHFYWMVQKMRKERGVTSNLITCTITITWFWLAERSAVQVSHQCKLHIVILDYDWLKDNRKFSKPMISHKMINENFVQKLWKMFSNYEEKWLQERSSGLPSMQCFSCLYYIYIITL